MNVYFDTEFTGLHKDTTLISIGLVAENGKTFYAEFSDYDTSQVDDWIQENVIDNLQFNHMSTHMSARQGCVEMKGPKKYVGECLRIWFDQFKEPFGGVQLVSDVCHYDMVLLIDLFGSAFDLPKCVNAACHDINQDIARHFNITEAEAFDYCREDLIREEIPGKKHNSLYDARVIQAIYKIVNR